jgi:pilus assembly protein CpaF
MGSVSLPSKVIKEMIASSIDVIIQASRLRDGSRKIIKITEVLGMEGDVITTQDLLTYEVEGEGVDGKLIGQHYGNGISKPWMWERAKYFGDGPRLERVMSKLPEKESVL